MIKNLIRIPILLIILWILGSYIGSWYLLKPHNQGLTMPKELSQLGFENQSYQGFENNHLSAWQKLNNPENTTVILLHGVKADKSSLSQRALIYDSLGFNVILLDSRGHGESESMPISFGWNESKDLRLIIENLNNQGYKNIILHGLSLGAATSFYTLAGREMAIALISESCYSDIQSAFYHRMPDFPFKSIVFYPLFWFCEIKIGESSSELNPAEKAKNINCPVLLMYGDNEKVLPIADSESIFENISSKSKKKIVFENADHIDFLKHNPKKYLKELSLFLKPYAKPRTAKNRSGKEKR